MLVLGLETSCDETASSVVLDGRRVLSNVVASQHDLHQEYGGVVPEIASRAHVERVLPVIRAALRDAGVGLDDIDAVAVGHRPGLIGSLLVGVAAAKGLAWSLDVPLVGVDHVHAHLYAALMGNDPAREPAREPLGESNESALFPALGLVVSGGHTLLYAVRSPVALERLGGTIDDAVGEAYDKAAVILGLGHPWGPLVDRLAQAGDERAVALPTSRLSSDSLDMSFSGLKTALLYKVRGFPGQQEVPPALNDARRADLAACFQKAAIGALILKIERALDHMARRGEPVRSILVGGGVSANSRLRAESAALARRRGLRILVPPMDLCTDNAAMIAGLGHARLSAGLVDSLSLSAQPTTAEA